MLIIIRWLPALVLCLIIFFLSSRPGTIVTEVYVWNVLLNKLAHLILYFFLTFTFFRATKNLFYAFIFTVCYAITDEFHQLFTPTRSGKFNDMLLDAAGSGYALLVLWKFYQHLPSKLKNWLEF